MKNNFDWRTPAQNILVSLFVGFGIVSIGLNGEMAERAPAAKISPKAGAPAAFAAPPALEITPWLDRAAKLTSLDDFLKITSGHEERKLLQSFKEDELNDGSPFAKLSSHYPLAVLLSKGVKSYQRGTFRTTSFHGESGYDLLTYQILHTDGTHSEVMAYLDKGDDSDITSEMLDKRSEFVLFSLYESGTANSINLYRDNELSSHGSVPGTEAMAMVTRRVNASVPLMAITSR